MIKKQIKSHNELKQELKNNKSVYCLLYKPESELSKCVSDKLNSVIQEENDGVICLADVSQVRDIHPEYNVTAAPTLLVFREGKNINQVRGCNDEEFYSNLFSGNYFSAKTSDGTSQPRVTVYSTPTCPHCTSLKKYLESMSITYRDVDVSKDQDQAQQLVNRTGQQGVPQTEINGSFVLGFDKNKLNRLLGLN